jgi:hypothetical protein
VTKLAPSTRLPVVGAVYIDQLVGAGYRCHSAMMLKKLKQTKTRGCWYFLSDDRKESTRRSKCCKR